MYLFEELKLWADDGQMRPVIFMNGVDSAHAVAASVAKMSKAKAAVIATICMSGGYDVGAFKTGTLGSLLASGLIVVYGGMAYPLDVWE
jgi:hypothetical protein